MAQSVSTNIKGPNGPLSIVIGEATTEQHSPCCALAAAAFAPHVQPSVFVEHSELLSQHPLIRNNGRRYWCISLEDDPLSVIAMCGTLRRPLLVRDSQSMREENGYCIFMVATHAQYRRLGLAKMIMKYVAEWLDGEGDAAVSMLYTSIGDFYVSMGWDMMRSMVSTITDAIGSFQTTNQTGLPNSRLLSDDEIPELCNRDVKDLKDTFEKASVGADDVHLAVLPNTDMITCSFKWGDVLISKLYGQTPEVHGAICEEADTWIYWEHGFDKLAITRVRTPSDINQASSEVLASLLLHALEEAQKHGFSKITVWEPSVRMLSALELIKRNSTIEAKTEERPNSITSVRWRNSSRTKKTILHLNESYAAN